MSEYALRLANGADTAARVRAADALGLTPNGAVRARGGVRPDGGGAVTVVAGTMSVQVTPFSCWVDASPAGQIGYPFVCDAAKTLAIDPGDATLVRVDTVAVVVKENAFDGTGATTATLQIVKGTPGAGAPGMPTSACIPLRNISVPAGASAGSGGLSAGALSTDRRVYTTALGGVVPVGSQADRDAMAKYESLTVYRTDTDRVEVYDGTNWRPVSPNEVNAWRPLSGTSGWTNQSTYAVVPDATDRAALTSTLTKTSAASGLVVTLDATVQLSSGVAQVIFMGLRINGTDYDVTRRHSQVAAQTRVTLHATRRIAGLPAGALTIEPVLRTSTGASQVTGWAGDDQISYQVREVA